MRNHRITKTCFRTCSRCLSRSQAPLCLCTRRLVSTQPEGTFARLRYTLGGDRPSQTTHHAMSRIWFTDRRLEPKRNKGGISRLAPPKLAPRFQSLPPILHMLLLGPLQSCSKGAQGLSVLPGLPVSLTRVAFRLGRGRGSGGIVKAFVQVGT